MDFTGSPLFRHPHEMGGGYYSFTLLTTPIVCLYIGSRYLAHVEDEAVQATLSHVFTNVEVYGGLGALAILQLSCFGLFLALIPKKYR